MSGRTSMSDILRSQEALIEAQRSDIERLIGVVSDVLAALTENRRPNASESVTIKRAGIGDKPTTIDVSAVVQDGETLEDARRRASIEYEHACARFPLPSGYAHAAPLGDEENPRNPPTLVEQLEGSVKK
jgi:hypothetical protein